MRLSPRACTSFAPGQIPSPKTWTPSPPRNPPLPSFLTPPRNDGGVLVLGRLDVQLQVVHLPANSAF